MYAIQNTSTDFPDAAQRFNWCNCQGDTRKKLGLTGLGDTPIFDFSFWGNELSGGGQPTTTPAGAQSTMFSTLPAAPAIFGGSWLIPGLAVAGLAWFMFGRKGGRR